MTGLKRAEHVRRVTFYALLIFVGFVIVWLILIANARSRVDSRRPLVTSVEVHSLDARWGYELLTVPIIAATVAIGRRNRRGLGDLAIAFIVALGVALGMVFFPAAVMGGHVRWPAHSTHLDPTSFIDDALTYAIAVAIILLLTNWMAARYEKRVTRMAL